MWPPFQLRLVLIASGLHALSASVPLLVVPQAWLSLLLPSGGAEQCVADATCLMLAQLVGVLVVGFAISYMLAGLLAGQAAALLSGAIAKSAVFVVLSRAYFRGDVAVLAFLTGLTDLALAVLYVVILVGMRSPKKNKE